MPCGKKKIASSHPTPATLVQNKSSRNKQASHRGQEHRDTDDAGTTLDGTTKNSSKLLTREDIPALVQETVKTLALDGGSFTQQGEREEGQSNNNITNMSSSPPQKGQQQGHQSNSNIIDTSSS